MTTMNRRALITGAGAAALGIAAVSSATTSWAAEKPPVIAAPVGSQAITVLLRLTAKDPATLKAYLMKVVPVTRMVSGCRYSHSYQDPQKLTEFVLIQGWDSVAQQQSYVAWRNQTGDLKQFIDLLAKPPIVESFELFDA
jgi:quinol monooxygenase YgiN